VEECAGSCGVTADLAMRHSNPHSVRALPVWPASRHGAGLVWDAAAALRGRRVGLDPQPPCFALAGSEAMRRTQSRGGEGDDGLIDEDRGRLRHLRWAALPDAASAGGRGGQRPASTGAVSVPFDLRVQEEWRHAGLLDLQRG